MAKGKKLDTRVVKTREKLTAAFAQMMSTTPYDQITVFDLCDAADVRRATFYKHFNDKSDFFSYIISIIQEKILKSVEKSKNQIKTPVDFYTLYVVNVLEYLRFREPIVKNLLKSGGLSIIMTLILDKNYESLVKDLSMDVENGLQLPADVHTVARFMNGGISWMIVSWLQEHYCSEEEFVKSVEGIISKFLTR